MFKDYYKKSLNMEERQETRRSQLLNKQKEKRLEFHDNHRNGDIKEYTVPNKRYHHTIQEIYGKEIGIQLSEWMREVPRDLNDWLLVPCPRGKRCLVTAGRGLTRMYSKTGRFRFEFRSRLPGGGGESVSSGSGNENRQRGQCTILDCIYDGKDTYYVLDAISLSRINLLHCEAQFRFFWLRSHFDDMLDENLLDITQTNWKRFIRLKYYDLAQEEQTAPILQNYPIWPDNKPQLDGFLFYHKDSSYTCGPTPLVCWLFPFMIPDVLHMDVSNEYIRPSNYTNPFAYMDEFDKNLARKHRKSKQMAQQNNKIESMDGVEVEAEECDELDEFVDGENNTLEHVLSERNLQMPEEEA